MVNMPVNIQMTEQYPGDIEIPGTFALSPGAITPPEMELSPGPLTPVTPIVPTPAPITNKNAKVVTPDGKVVSPSQA